MERLSFRRRGQLDAPEGPELPLLALHKYECMLCVSLSGLLEISTVERGVVSLFGVKSTLFIAMNNKGRLYTTVSCSGEGKLHAEGSLNSHH